jgi:hypothetical protein
MSCRAFSRRIGVSPEAVSKAIERGRLKESVGRGDDGRPYIKDPVARRARMEPPTLIDSQTQANLERARKLRLENDVTESRLIPVDLVNKERFEAQRIVRESILNMPARVAGELAVETDPARVQLRLDTLLRDALNAAADMLISDEALLAVNG